MDANIDVTAIAHNIAAAAVIVALLVQIAKQYLTSDKAADRDVQLLAVGFGVLLCLAAGLAVGDRATLDLANDALRGFLSGCVAVGLYHIQQALPVQALPPRG